jgi:serine/threonine protein kinase
VAGLEAIHNQKIIHRDLKGENVLLHFPNTVEKMTKSELASFNFADSSDVIVKISDLGASRVADFESEEDITMSVNVGTPMY